MQRDAIPEHDQAPFVYQPRDGKTLVVGSKVYRTRRDRRTLFTDAVGWDLFAGEGVDAVVDLEQPLAEPIPRFDHVDCVSVLEHVRQPWLMAANLERLLVTDGTIFVAVPFVWRVHAYPDDYWRMTTSALRSLFTCVEWVTLAYQHHELVPEGAKIRPVVVFNHQHFPRTTTVGFGRKSRVKDSTPR